MGIVDELVQRVDGFNETPGLIKDIRFLFPVMMGVAVLDHIRRAVAVSHRQSLPDAHYVLRWLDFKPHIAVALAYTLSGLPDYLNWKNSGPKIMEVGTKVLNATCGQLTLEDLQKYSQTLNVNSNYFATYFFVVCALAAVVITTGNVAESDGRVNGETLHFRAHKINYYITFTSAAAFFFFQTSLLWFYDLRFPPVNLETVYNECLY